jgi:hypothetical protein
MSLAMDSIVCLNVPGGRCQRHLEVRGGPTPGCHYGETTMVLKADGNRLSGEITSWYTCGPSAPRLLKWAIEDGKIDGEAISFKITYDEAGKKTSSGTKARQKAIKSS